MIDTESFFVHKIHLLTTVLKRTDGLLIFVSNAVLSAKFVCNVRRSQDMTDVVVFDIDYDTSQAKILSLRERIMDFLKSNPQDFTGRGDLINVAFDGGPDRLRLTITAQHRGNFQDGTQKSNRKIMFNLFLKTACEKLGIRYSPMPQRILIEKGMELFQQH